MLDIFLFLFVSILPVLQVLSFSTLITFDVDGTLVSSSPGWERGAHGRSFGYAVQKVLGGNERDNGSGSILASIPTVPEVLEKPEYHGSTDGLILLRLAAKTLEDRTSRADSASKVSEMMEEMHGFVSACSDDEVTRGIAPLPGVLDTLRTLATEHDTVACGLVTGNVEGIARRKMRALGIWDTGALTSIPSAFSSPEFSTKVWNGIEDVRFLGGFGSDYCSGDIINKERNYLDRGEQLAICVQRYLALSSTAHLSSESQPETHTLQRVIHVGDAPADILAAKYYASHATKPPGVCVSVVGVDTGSYSAQELRDLCGEIVPGKWEPVVLEGRGVGEEQDFLKACGLI